MEDIRKELFGLQDLKYKEFHSGLCPNVDKIIGVRIPKLREIAKRIAKENYKEFLENSPGEYYEELVLQGLVIGYAKISLQETISELEKFVPKINSWAVCDTTCSNLKITKKYMKEMWNFLERHIKSKREYEIRFALVMYLDYFITDEYIELIFERVNKIKSNDYYVEMAIAWLLSFAYIRQKEKTLEYLKNNKLDKFTQNKSIQKICESYRVSDEEKKNIRKYKK